MVLNNSCGVLWGQVFWVLCGRGGNGVGGIRVRWEIRVLRDWGNMGNGENGKRGVKRNWNFLTYNEPNERALYLSKKITARYETKNNV